MDKARKISRHGWNPDLPGGRDFFCAVPPEVLRKLPDKGIKIVAACNPYLTRAL
jgi:hypothetical protein